MRDGHSLNKCKCSKCKNCGEMHNTLLHEQGDGDDPTREEKLKMLVSNHSSNTVNSNAILPTAIIKHFDVCGKPALFRAIIDYGTERSFICGLFITFLRRRHANVNISGFNIDCHW